jgi:ABC-type glycerol-3-phosphate transport system substrate-binding protein
MMSFTKTASRLLAGLATLSLSALALAGCAPSSTTTAGTGSIDPATTKGTVRILMEDVPDSDIVASLIPEFKKVYANVDVQIEKLPYDQMKDKLVASFQAPEPAYDLIVVDNSWVTDFVDAGFIIPMDDRIDAVADYDAADFFSSLTDITKVDGVRYGVPFYNYALGYIYNTDIVSPADVPTTLDGLVSYSASITTPKQAGLAMQPQTGYKIMEEWTNFLYAAGGSIYGADGKANLNTPEAKAALNAYIELYNNSAPKNSLNWAFDDAFRSFSSGGSAAMVSYNWNLAALNQPDSGPYAGKFKLAPMPGGKSALGSWTWAIPTNSGAPDAAWAFAAWLTSKPIDVKRVVAGGAAIRQSTMTDPTVLADGFGADYYQAVTAILSNAAPLTEGPMGDEMIQAVGEALNSAVSGTKTVDEALQIANDAINSIQNR